MAELIVALDVNSRQEAVDKVVQIGDAVNFYKIGLELFTAEGPDVVKAVKDLGKRVFLDLKFHDIPRTVERSVRSGGKLGVDLMTIHSVGASAMIKAAAEAAAEFPGLNILAVTVLTSLDAGDLSDIGIAGRTPAEQVEAMARFAVENGAHGLVCSPKEVGALSSSLRPGTLFVTPGVRPAGADVGDQKRIATPADAVRDGATHLVVGRPVLAASDPAAAAREILSQMA
ncbi:MAG: orotidine-5'-phosphate decarboxylase [Kiritimatiellae bacterium]|jgi:orotidine-5'-phosphate decarboxylase|nr:orotidine-5'-phosphate decarboxylase [Kiritimatiellia bacterium]